MEQSQEGYNDANGKVKWNVDTIDYLSATYGKMYTITLIPSSMLNA